MQIGINLSDPIFRGVYHGKKAHEDDLPHIVERALGAGCRKLMVTGSDLPESEKALELAEQYRMPQLVSEYRINAYFVSSWPLLRNSRSASLFRLDLRQVSRRP